MLCYCIDTIALRLLHIDAIGYFWVEVSKYDLKATQSPKQNLCNLHFMHANINWTLFNGFAIRANKERLNNLEKISNNIK